MAKNLATETAAALDQVADARDPGPRPRDPEILAELFAPEIVLPDQLQQGFRRDSYLSGEKALMLAVLEDGIRCFQEHLTNPRSNPRLLSKQAEDWIRAVTTSGPSRSTTSARRSASTPKRSARSCSPGKPSASKPPARRTRRRPPRRSTGSTSAPSAPAASAKRASDASCARRAERWSPLRFNGSCARP